MFDLRYHVASLAAVFFALVIGILVGVALAHHGLSSTDRQTYQLRIDQLQAEVDRLNTQMSDRQDAYVRDSEYVRRTYSLFMNDRLRGKRIALIFVGSVDGDLQASVTRTLSDAEARQRAPVRVRALKVPIDVDAIARRLTNRPLLAAYAGDDQVEALGHALGLEFAAGNETPLWNALQELLVEERSGVPKPAADGVVVVRTAAPQMGPTARFLHGLYSGLHDSRVPAVGVEASNDGDSAMLAFQRAGLSTVDDIDTPVGKLALAILLSDRSVTGNYGTNTSTAHDGPLPDVALTPVTTTGG